MFGINAAARHATKMFEEAVNSIEGRGSLRALPRKLEGKPNAARFSLTRRGEIRLYGRFAVMLHPHQRARGQTYMNHLGRFLKRDTACRMLDETSVAQAACEVPDEAFVPQAPATPTFRSAGASVVHADALPDVDVDVDVDADAKATAHAGTSPKADAPVQDPETTRVKVIMDAPPTSLKSALRAKSEVNRAPRRVQFNDAKNMVRQFDGRLPVQNEGPTPPPWRIAEPGVAQKPVIAPKPRIVATRLKREPFQPPVTERDEPRVSTKPAKTPVGNLVRERLNFFESKIAAGG